MAGAALVWPEPLLCGRSRSVYGRSIGNPAASTGDANIRPSQIQAIILQIKFSFYFYIFELVCVSNFDLF